MKLFTKELNNKLSNTNIESFRCEINKDKRIDTYKNKRIEWSNELNELTNTKYTDNDNTIKPRKALYELEKVINNHDCMVSTDIGNICAVAGAYLSFNKARSFFHPGTYGNCGISLPLIMGAKVAKPDRIAISYAGDGAWGMSLNEIMTCVRENIPVTGVVFNNGQWGAEKKNQVIWFGDK